MESNLIKFYKGLIPLPDTEYYIDDIWMWTNDQLEASHNYIQWLFPLKEPSNFNPDAPILTDEDIEAFKSNAALKHHLGKSVKVFLKFLGLKIDYFLVEKEDNWKEREFLWKIPNHNWLRITRVLKSLNHCDSTDMYLFYDALVELHAEGYVSDNSFKYWEDSVIVPKV